MEGLNALKISEEKKKYIVDTLNPVLEEMVAECIHRMPNDPVPFMLEWLEQKKVNEEDRQLSPEERQKLDKENQALKEEVMKVKSQMQEAAKLAADDDQEEEEEEDDDADDEPPPGFDNFQSKGARQSVSAEAYGEWNAKKAFVAPLIPKSDEQKDRLKSVLSESFLFASLEENDFGIIIGAMKEVTVKKGERVIQQGDNGDFLFVIESGEFNIVIKSKESGEEKVVKTCAAGDVFGELALLYNAPRAASVESKGDSVCWQLDRETFNAIVKDAAQKKRNRYDNFLAKVPLLQSMDAYERSQIADALKVEVFSDQQTVVSAGELGQKFYILEEGAAAAMKNGQQVMDYKPGDYFGELALINSDSKRQATVIAKGNSRLLSIDRTSFKRLLDVKALLEQSNRYK